jgi:hypothetical protein
MRPFKVMRSSEFVHQFDAPPPVGSQTSTLRIERELRHTEKILPPFVLAATPIRKDIHPR